MRTSPLFAPAILLAVLAHQAGARSLDLPVRSPGATGLARTSAPAYSGDVFELRLTPEASARAFGSARDGARLERVGIASLDGVLRSLGVWLEPEFRGETPPPSGSAAVDFTSFYVAHLPPSVSLESALDRFEHLDGVASVQPIAILHTSAVPNDSLWAESYWFFQPSRRDIHAPEAWDITTGDTSIVVAVLDSGVLPYHPDLGGSIAGGRGQLWTNWVEQGGLPGIDDDGNGFVDDTGGWDFVDLSSSTLAEAGEDWEIQDNDPNDFSGHGTEVAGFVGALTDNGIGGAGTVWKTRIMPVRMAWVYPGAVPSAAEVRMDFAAQSVLYAARNGAAVINCSWQNLDQGGLGAAVTEAIRGGSVVVVAGGTFASVNDLALRDDVISVAATASNDVLPGFSNVATFIDLAAPGAAMIGPAILRPAPVTPNYRSGLNGTSYSAPLVCGAVALLQAHQRELMRDPLTPYGALFRLRETADDILAENPGREGLYGGGRLNLLRALTETTGSSATRLGGAVVGSPLVIERPGMSPRHIFATSNARLVFIDAPLRDTMAVVTLPATPGRGPAAADLGLGRGIGVFVGLLNGTMVGVDPSGNPLPGWPASALPTSQLTGGPALGDLDGDGGLEIVCGSNQGVWAWHGDGSPVAGFPAGVGMGAIRAPVALTDLDGIPGVEIVATTLTGTVHVMRGDGTPLPGWPLTFTGPISAPSIGPMGTGSTPVLQFAAGQQLHAMSVQAQEQPGFPLILGGNVIADSDVPIADLDGNGGLDRLVLNSGVARLNAVDSTGVALAGWPRPMFGTPSGSPVVGDLDPAPGAEVLAYRASTLVGFTAAGDSLATFPKNGRAGAFPTIAELGDDPRMEVSAGVTTDSTFFVYDAGSPSAALPIHPWPTYRGNAARTGSVLYAPPLTPVDIVGPNRVIDLRLTVRADTSVTLSWTAVADDGGGPAERYVLRAAEQPMNETVYANATYERVQPGAVAPGETESRVCDGLLPAHRYWFALEAIDASDNASPLSNVLIVETSVGGPLGGRTGVALAAGRQPTRTPIVLYWQASPDGQARAQDIRVYDLSGRERKRFSPEPGLGGVVQWDGRDAQGMRLPAGVYFARLVSGSVHAQTRIVLLP